MPVPMYDVGFGTDGVAGASCAGGTSDRLGLELAIADATPVHDEVLIKVTRKINRILEETREKGRRKNLNLELINVGGQALLAWTSPAKLGPEARRAADIAEINRILCVHPRRSHEQESKAQSSD